ncbi:MAG: alpha/beta hydrolase [Proteobacteria bacterium]|nr:alpha/beta hydrolase [Pseudomonadota bacterium]
MLTQTNSQTTSKYIINSNQLEFAGCSIKYFTYVPKKVKTRDVLVLIHGISRNAHEMMREFKAYADKQGMLMIAPLFDKRQCRDYQRLGRAGVGPRADYILQCMLQEFAENNSLCVGKLLMVGNSGGAQFVHRYAFAYPHQLRKTVLIAAGWYTFPKNLPFPFGLNRIEQLPDLRFKVKRFLSVPFKVYVGDKDNLANDSLNQSNLVAWQGKNRILRAKKWVASMQRAARRHEIKSDISFKLLASGKHDFTQMASETDLLADINDWLAQ